MSRALWLDAMRTARALRRLGVAGGVRVIARELLDLWDGMQP